MSVPVSDLARRLAEIPRDREVIAYCRGPYCVYAIDAVELLRAHGYRALRMVGGLPDWRGDGRPVVPGSSSG
jgi:rhodanese-related sulfurtransferase